MSTHMRWLWLLLALAGAGQAQTIQITLPHAYDLYYVGDLDPRGDMTGVGNEITVAVSGIPQGTWTLEVELSFGETWLARGHLDPFTLAQPNLGPWTLNEIRNNDLPVGFHGSGDFNDGFIDQVSGNSLPAGVYTVHATLESVPAGATIHSQGSFTITDPRRIDLQLPWDGGLVFTDQPTFSWSGRADNYRLRVCEFNPDFHGSLQEAIAGEPMWLIELPSTSVVYGQGGGPARPLVSGNQYVWMVEALLHTTSGFRDFPSAIRSFRVEQGQGGQQQPDLASLLGGLTPSQLAGLANMLAGYHLNGVILVDGRPVSLEEFQQLLGQLASGELNIASIRIE